MIDLRNPSTGFASAAVFLSATVWGLYWVPLRIFTAEGVEGGWAVALLNLPPVLVLVVLAAWKMRQISPFLGRALLIGVFTGAGLAFYASGLVYSSVVRVTLLFYLTPVWSTLIGMVWLGERVGPGRWLAIATGLLGMGVLLSGGDQLSLPLNIGDLLALLSGMAWGLGAAMIRRYEGVPLVGMTLFQFAFCTVIAIGCALAFGPAIPPETGALIAALPVALLASLGFILPTVVIIFWAQKFLYPGRAGLLMMSEALVAVITASIFLPEEQMAWLEWMGAAMIIAACLIEVLSSGEEAPVASG